MTMMVANSEGDAPTRRRRPKLTVEQGNSEDPENGGLTGIKLLKRNKRRRRVNKNDNDDEYVEEPFLITVLKVGLTLAVLTLCSYHSYRWMYPYVPPPDVSAYDDDDDVGSAAALPAANIVQQQNEHSNNSMLAKQQQQQQQQKKDDDDDDDDNTYHLHLGSDSAAAAAAAAAIKTPPPLPVWELGPASDFDAYSIAAKYKEFDNDMNNNIQRSNNSVHSNENTTAFWRAAAGLRRQFAEYYGGENAARALLERGLTTGGGATMLSSSSVHNANTHTSSNNTNTSNTNTYNSNWTVTGSDGGDQTHAQQSHVPRDLHATACRMQQALRQKRPFRMAFGGYSVTVGRGNYFKQSFPLVMEKHLHTVMHLLGLELHVKNAAIGGCPAFPYGWCMSNFWGEDVDVVSWDYSMNEAGGIPEGLEAYLRHTLELKRKPALIVKDTHLAQDRRDLLQQYFDMTTTTSSTATAKTTTGDRLGLVQDYVVIHTDPAAKPFLDRAEEHRPVGFQEWRKFGSPPGAPGQALHHPAVKEHELIAWLLTMHFLRALEWLATSRQEPSILQCLDSDDDGDEVETTVLPRPVVEEVSTATRPWTSILFGEQESNSSSSRWRMKPVHCRTSFEPILSGDLSSIAVSGSVGEDLNIMLPKSKMYYNRGWVLDLSDGEKQAKRKLDVYGGLGYVDRKKAYYGIFPSGTLRFLLPYDNEKTQEHTQKPVVGDKATEWFKSIVVCEVNEKRDAGACQTEKDLSLIVGGANVTDAVMMDAPGTLYLGKKLCLYVPVPNDAILTSRNELKKNETTKLLLPPDQIDVARDEEVGLALELFINNRHILLRDQACSVSHVVWEQQHMNIENLAFAAKG